VLELQSCFWPVNSLLCLFILFESHQLQCYLQS